MTIDGIFPARPVLCADQKTLVCRECSGVAVPPADPGIVVEIEGNTVIAPGPMTTREAIAFALNTLPRGRRPDPTPEEIAAGTANAREMRHLRIKPIKPHGRYRNKQNFISRALLALLHRDPHCEGCGCDVDVNTARLAFPGRLSCTGCHATLHQPPTDDDAYRRQKRDSHRRLMRLIVEAGNGALKFLADLGNQNE
jgi:hypothetical protein